MSLFDFCLNVSLVFSKGVKFRNVLCEIVVKLGKLYLVKSVKLDLEYYGLACKLFCVVLFGEGNVNVKFLTDIVTDNFFLKAGDKLTRTKFKREVFTLSALKGSY